MKNEKNKKNIMIKKDATVDTDQEKQPNIVNVQCKHLEKGPGANWLRYNIAVPKNCTNLIVNLQRRNIKPTSLVCCFEPAEVVHQSPTEVVIKN